MNNIKNGRKRQQKSFPQIPKKDKRIALYRQKHGHSARVKYIKEDNERHPSHHRTLLHAPEPALKQPTKERQHHVKKAEQAYNHVSKLPNIRTMKK